MIKMRMKVHKSANYVETCSQYCEIKRTNKVKLVWLVSTTVIFLWFQDKSHPGNDKLPWLGYLEKTNSLIFGHLKGTPKK